jgi:glutathione S-transferase
MITVHHLNNSRSQRILWLLEELDLPFEVKRYERTKAGLAPETLKLVHPLGKSPVITDGDVTLAETGAIVEYLVEKQQRLRPRSGTPEELLYRFFLHYAEGSLMPHLLMSLVFSKVQSAPAPFFIRPVINGIVAKVRKLWIGPQTELHFSYLEGELKDRRWFAGEEFSAADVQMSFPIEAAKAQGLLNDKPRLQDFLKSIHARPAYQRALAKGGEYELSAQ